MSIYKTKGAVASVEIASTLTPVSQIIEMGIPNKKTTSFESMTIDQPDNDPGKGKEMSGWAESDGWDAEIFWDPVLAVHEALDDAIDTPAKTVWQIELLGDGLATSSSTIDFTAAGLTLGPTLPFEDGMKANISAEIDGIPVYTAGS